MHHDNQSTGRTSKNFGQQAGSARLAHYREQGVQVGTNSGMEQQKYKCTSRKEKDGFPQIQKPKGEVLMILRGRKEYLLTLTNAFTKEKQITANYGGRYLGVSDDIMRVEGDLYRGQPEACFALIRFKDMEGAQHWTESSPMFKQKDWPTPADVLELFAVELSYIPLVEELKAFQLIELHGLMTTPEDFREQYVKPVSKKLNEKMIYHGVVATHNVNRLRVKTLRADTYVLLHCAESLDKLKSFYDSTAYSDYREYRQRNVAETDSCFFTIKPLSAV